MIAYTEDKKRYNLDTDNFIDEGEYGRVYLTSDNKCLKIFKQSISRKDKMSFDEDVFNIIRELKPKNIYTLGDLYYNKSLTRILGYLSESFVLLSEYNIRISDTCSQNVILNNSGITIIDTDFYYIDANSNKLAIKKSNIYDLGELFSWIYMNSLKETDFNKRSSMIDKIEKLFIPIGTFGVEPVIKKLIKYKYPIDYLQNR